MRSWFSLFFLLATAPALAAPDPLLAGGLTWSGKTVADALLREDTLKIVLPYSRKELVCPKLVAVDTQAMQRQEISNPLPPIAGEIFERWTVKGCDEALPFIVRYTADEKGTTTINVRLEKLRRPR
jgi:hypothetical protein